MTFISADTGTGFVNRANGRNYDYRPSEAYAKQIGLEWFGNDYPGLVNADIEAESLGFTQEQVNAAMRQHLWQVKLLFSPKNYKFIQRLKIALFFITGWKPS